jgi:mRNA-degrading endonuclease HigB of HigAB toxin-antitoxin module
MEIQRSITEDLKEYNETIIELSEKEIALYEWKQVYDIKAEAIVKETDFKTLYGANNQKVRDNHIRNELNDWYEIIKDLEFSINYLNRRIGYLKELIRTKRSLMELKGI